MLLGINPENIKVIYRGRDPEIFDTLERQVEKTNEKLIDNYICVGRLIKRKGQLDLVDAFAEHIKKYPASKLILVGEGPLRNELETKIAKLDLKR